MSGQIDNEYGRKLFSERKAYKIESAGIVFVIEDMLEVETGWRIWFIRLTCHDQYWRDYMTVRGTKQGALARINEIYSS
jgi:hypothetical protein